MILWKAGQSGERRSGLLAKSFWLLSGLVLAAWGCESPVPSALVDASGNQIRRSAIDAILENQELDDAEKRQALRDLGITDEQLIEALVAHAD